MFELKPDFEKTRARIEAFWEADVLDRPVVMFSLPKPYESRVPLPLKHHKDPDARWLDTSYQTDLTLASLLNHEYLGDTLPIAYANLGPEVFSAFYGCPLHFGDYGTSWSEPILHEWQNASQIQLDWHSP